MRRSKQEHRIIKEGGLKFNSFNERNRANSLNRANKSHVLNDYNSIIYVTPKLQIKIICSSAFHLQLTAIFSLIVRQTKITGYIYFGV